jgi:hypothetical protein
MHKRHLDNSIIFWGGGGHVGIAHASILRSVKCRFFIFSLFYTNQKSRKNISIFYLPLLNATAKKNIVGPFDPLCTLKLRLCPHVASKKNPVTIYYKRTIKVAC